MEARSARWARMPADREPLLDHLTAAGPGWRGVGRRHGYGSLPSVRCFESEDGAKLAPAGITDALGEGVVSHHVGRLQVFVIEGVVLLDQGQGGLVVEVLPLALDMLMDTAQEMDRLAPPLAPLLAARDPPLGASQCHLGHTEDAGFGKLAALSQGGAPLDPE